VLLALRTQQIIAHETGVARTIDPLAGSYFVESLTDELESRSHDLIERIDGTGGYVSLLAQGIPQRWIAESAYRYEQAIGAGDRVKVGVNRFTTDSGAPPPRLFESDDTAARRQRDRLTGRLARRDTAAAIQALAGIRLALAGGANTMPALIGAARAGCTVGEITSVLREEFGEYTEPAPW
jgi:methylmalonyl-CoA mutase N-terminal domain/subunit